MFVLDTTSRFLCLAGRRRGGLNVLPILNLDDPHVCVSPCLLECLLPPVPRVIFIHLLHASTPTKMHAMRQTHECLRLQTSPLPLSYPFIRRNTHTCIHSSFTRPHPTRSHISTHDFYPEPDPDPLTSLAHSIFNSCLTPSACFFPDPNRLLPRPTRK